MKNDRKLVLFDVDGTLVPHPGEIIPESTFVCLDELKKNGHVVALSTGRDMDGHYSVEYRNQVCPDAIVHLNGARVSAGGETVYEHRISSGVLHTLYDIAMEYGLCIGAVQGAFDYYTHTEIRDREDRLLGKNINRCYQPFEDVFDKDIHMNALCISGDIPLARRVIEQRCPGMRVVGYNLGNSADLVEEGISKSEGMKVLCEYYHIPVERTFAFGDSQNDLEIVAAAGTGIAMGNAAAKLKECADYVTEHINDDGIYRACVHFGLIGDVLKMFQEAENR